MRLKQRHSFLTRPKCGHGHDVISHISSVRKCSHFQPFLKARLFKKLFDILWSIFPISHMNYDWTWTMAWIKLQVKLSSCMKCLGLYFWNRKCSHFPLISIYAWVKRGYYNGLREISPISFKHYTKVNDRDKKESMNRGWDTWHFIYYNSSKKALPNKSCYQPW